MTRCGAVIGHLEHRALAQRHRLHRRGVQLQTRRLAGLNLHIITVLFIRLDSNFRTVVALHL